MYSGITSGRVLHEKKKKKKKKSLVEWREISMKLSVGKYKQINF